MHFISLLSFCLSLLASSCWASAPPRIKRRQFTDFYAAVDTNDPDVPSIWACSPAQLAILGEAIEQAHEMALIAESALDVEGSELSASYCAWFGPGAPYIFALAATC